MLAPERQAQACGRHGRPLNLKKFVNSNGVCTRAAILGLSAHQQTRRLVFQ
jgi:hypothetical protein